MIFINCLLFVFRMQNGAPALIYAAQEGHPECIEALVRHGANVEIQAKV